MKSAAGETGGVRQDPRAAFGRTLSGDIIEVGPGSEPFPVGSGARVRYVDRSVAGGRDATWPELAGTRRGPKADVDIDLNVDGLAPFPDSSVDAIVASHVIEHVANPIAVLREFERVLRPAGRLALIVPDRGLTFDRVRQPTPLARLIRKLEEGTTTVSDDEIREFCSAIYHQPPIHPEPVREWHNPCRLDTERLDLHRRRSIHVHCWSTEEFAALIAGLLARGLVHWRLAQLFLPGEPLHIEFGLLLERGSTTGPGAGVEFVRDWATAVRATGDRDAGRIARFACALHRDMPSDVLASAEASLLAAPALG